MLHTDDVRTLKGNEFRRGHSRGCCTQMIEELQNEMSREEATPKDAAHI
jgi:hypothetical protein